MSHSSENHDAEAYKASPGKPPKHSQFKKGRSGNPRGRPRREPTWAELFRKELNKRIWVQENGNWIRITKRQAWMKRVAHATLKKDRRAVRTFLKIEKPADPKRGGLDFYIIGGR